MGHRGADYGPDYGSDLTDTALFRKANDDRTLEFLVTAEATSWDLVESSITLSINDFSLKVAVHGYDRFPTYTDCMESLDFHVKGYEHILLNITCHQEEPNPSDVIVLNKAKKCNIFEVSTTPSVFNNPGLTKECSRLKVTLPSGFTGTRRRQGDEVHSDCGDGNPMITIGRNGTIANKPRLIFCPDESKTEPLVMYMWNHMHHDYKVEFVQGNGLALPAGTNVEVCIDPPSRNLAQC